MDAANAQLLNDAFKVAGIAFHGVIKTLRFVGMAIPRHSGCHGTAERANLLDQGCPIL
jgi:hypothetical protein